MMTRRDMTLADYELEGFLFHGSPTRRERLEPRQARDWSSGDARLDGGPAVFASQVAALAVFMAVMPGAIGADGHFGYGVGDAGRLIFTASSLDAASPASGWVHVVAREGFVQRGFDWRAERVVVPTAVIRVTVRDLPFVIVGPGLPR